jgi:fido (protein-threonine AMPylation protein)
MAGTDVLRAVAELIDPSAVAIFERIVSADDETALRQDTDRPRTFDLAHLNDIHERLFADVCLFVGALRYLDTVKPGEPFLHHRWIDHRYRERDRCLAGVVCVLALDARR